MNEKTTKEKFYELGHDGSTSYVGVKSPKKFSMDEIDQWRRIRLQHRALKHRIEMWGLSNVEIIWNYGKGVNEKEEAKEILLELRKQSIDIQTRTELLLERLFGVSFKLDVDFKVNSERDENEKCL